MNAPQFSVHVDQAALAEQDLAAALSRRPVSDAPGNPAPAAPRHGTGDRKQAARARSERDHARSATTGRSYAFRRS